jgi:hypothetical protein
LYQKLSLEYKIRWAEEQLESTQKSINFWTNRELEYRKLYSKKSMPEAWECAHLKKIKQSKKAAKAENDYWLAELNKLKNQLELHRAFI